jgi:hypothetical protein
MGMESSEPDVRNNDIDQPITRVSEADGLPWVH